MLLRKVGDCLSYGLTHELLDDNDSKKSYFKAACLFLYFNDFLTVTTIKKIKKQLENQCKKLVIPEQFFEVIFRLLMADMKSVVAFDDYKEMITKLNEYEVPRGFFRRASLLFLHLPNVIVSGNQLYFVQNVDTEFTLVKYDINTDLSDETEVDECFIELSHSYSGIIGYNKEFEILYLRSICFSDIYVEYHIKSKQEKFVRGKAIGVIGGMIVLIKDNKLAVKIGEHIKDLKPASKLEMYIIENNDILVLPCFGEPAMFPPYRISLGGDIVNVSYQTSKQYLWKQMEDTMSFFRGIFDDESDEEEDDTLECEAEVLSLQYVEEYFNTNKNLERDDNARVCYLMCKKLGMYLDRGKDVLDYFYALLDASLRYEELVWNRYLSEKVYWRLIELETSGELQTCINDIGQFKEKLLEHAYWNDERIKEIEEYTLPEGKIGFFEFSKNNKLIAVSVSKEEGVCVGGVIMMRGEFRKGIVSFNYQMDKFEIQYSRLLSDKEIRKILKEFDLEDRPYHIVIEENALAIS